VAGHLMVRVAPIEVAAHALVLISLPTTIVGQASL